EVHLKKLLMEERRGALQQKNHKLYATYRLDDPVCAGHEWPVYHHGVANATACDLCRELLNMASSTFPKPGRKIAAIFLGSVGILFFHSLVTAPIQSAPPVLLGVSEAEPIEEGPAPRPTTGPNVYPLPINPILKQVPKIPDLQENLAQAPLAV